MKTVSQYRAEIQSMRSKFSLSILEDIALVAKQLHHNPKWYFEDVLRRAVGNAQEEPVDFDLPPIPEAYEHFGSRLGPLVRDEASVAKFETDFLRRVVDEDKADVPDCWMKELVSRLSKEALEAILELHHDYGRDINFSEVELETLAYLADRNFKVYEGKMLLPSLRAELEKQALKDLKRLGISAPTSELEDTQVTSTPKRQSLTKFMVEGKSLVDTYVEVVKVTRREEPSLAEWSDLAKKSKPYLSRKLRDPIFLADLQRTLEKKVGYREARTPEKKELFLKAAGIISQKLDQIRQRKYDDKTVILRAEERTPDPTSDLGAEYEKEINR